MNTQGRIAKLEALLARVQRRSNEPRATHAMNDVAAQSSREPVVSEEGTVEVDIDDALPPLRDDKPSVEVKAVVSATIEETEFVDAEPDEGDRESGEVEAAPASSRRPVNEEKPLGELAFGDEAPAPPIHTPPPESGKLPAAPAAVYEVDNTGVRAASSFVSPEGDLSDQTRPEVFGHRMPDVAPKSGPIEAVVARANLENASVGEFVGKSASTQPMTLGQLLDTTLSL